MYSFAEFCGCFAGAKPLLHHSILGAIATGSVTAGAIGNRVGMPVSNLTPALTRLVDAGFVVRHSDPIRDRRPTYALADPYLLFHYAILEPHRTALRDRHPLRVWSDRLVDTFGSQVRGPVFEQQARTWTSRYASELTVGGPPDHIAPSLATIGKTEHDLDVLVAADDASKAADRTVLAIGEAKAGETVGLGHLRRLERSRAALGVRAATAKLLLFSPSFHDELTGEAGRRGDVELIDLERLYHGD